MKSQFFRIIPWCSAEDGGSFYFVQIGEWLGNVFAVVGDVLDEFSWGSAAAAAYDDAFGSVGESVGGLLGNDDWCADQGEGLVYLEISVIEASPDSGISSCSAGVWSGDDCEDFFSAVAVQVDFIIDVVSVATFFFRNVIIVGYGLLQFGAWFGFCILFGNRRRNPCFWII